MEQNIIVRYCNDCKSRVVTHIDYQEISRDCCENYIMELDKEKDGIVSELEKSLE
ncbi:MAG: hypothetical protein ABIG37_03045 [Nanoarchaeota archaeon]|nr:hypothetical protein [Nanoarchaeota archaeon]